MTSKRFLFIFKIATIFILAYGLPLSASCEVYFSPKDHVAERLVQLIDQEKKSIKIAVYCLTHTKIAKALMQARERGVNIEMILDPFSIKSRSSIHRLAKANIALFIWDPTLNLQSKAFKATKKREMLPLMHHKFCVFGDHIVWTGSLNFTFNASQLNEENVVVIDDAELAKKYLEHFSQIKLYGCRSFNEYLAFHPKKRAVKAVKAP